MTERDFALVDTRNSKLVVAGDSLEEVDQLLRAQIGLDADVDARDAVADGGGVRD